MLTIDLFWSFRSPYCYLALDRILKMKADYDLQVAPRPVYPLAIRTPEFFRRVHPNYRRYNLLDTRRLAEFLGIPFRRPIPDPVDQNLATNEIAARQPHIHRLTRLGMAAAQAGRGLEFIDHVSRIIWDGRVTNWHKGAHLADAVARAGLDLTALDTAIAHAPAKYDARIAANQDALEAAGHWGVPTIVFNGEPFFGQDRLELLQWRLRQNGLRRAVTTDAENRSLRREQSPGVT
jgi:2-hydroxychromene-2-carboxylate isomerase